MRADAERPPFELMGSLPEPLDQCGEVTLDRHHLPAGAGQGGHLDRRRAQHLEGIARA
jgi:hypothetical protein